MTVDGVSVSVDDALVVAVGLVDAYLDWFAMEAERQVLAWGASGADVEEMRVWLPLELLIIRFEVLERVEAYVRALETTH